MCGHLIIKIFKINSYFFPIFSGEFLFFLFFRGMNSYFPIFYHSYYLTPCISSNLNRQSNSVIAISSDNLNGRSTFSMAEQFIPNLK